MMKRWYFKDEKVLGKTYCQMVYVVYPYNVSVIVLD